MDIKLNGISKRYPPGQFIFKNICYSFKSAKCYAVKGHNGSGKSTLIQILSGYTSPTDGQILYQSNKTVIKRSLIYQYIAMSAPYMDVIEDFSFYEMLRFHKKIKPTLPQYSDVLHSLNFDKTKYIKHYSSGMKQRLKLALTLLSDVPIILLDEPTNNLDTSGIDWYKKLLLDFKDKRLIIISSNHSYDYDFCTSFENTLNILDYK